MALGEGCYCNKSLKWRSHFGIGEFLKAGTVLRYITEKAKTVLKGLLIKIWTLKLVLVKTQKEVMRATEKTFIILRNINHHEQNGARNMKVVSQEVSDGNEEHVGYGGKTVFLIKQQKLAEMCSVLSGKSKLQAMSYLRRFTGKVWITHRVRYNLLSF